MKKIVDKTKKCLEGAQDGRVDEKRRQGKKWEIDELGGLDDINKSGIFIELQNGCCKEKLYCCQTNETDSFKQMMSIYDMAIVYAIL